MKMKLLIRTLSLLAIASLTLFFANCGGDDGDPKSEEEVQLDKLKGTWEVVSAELEGNPGAQIDTDFTLTISGTFDSDSPEGPYSFSVTGTQAPSPWPPSGTWEFGGDPKTQIVRLNDNMGIVYSIDSGSGNLTLLFSCPTGGCQFAGARTKEVEGDWEFVLSPQ